MLVLGLAHPAALPLCAPPAATSAAQRRTCPTLKPCTVAAAPCAPGPRRRLVSTPWQIVRWLAPVNLQDNLADIESAFLNIARPIANFVQDTAYKAFSIFDSSVRTARSRGARARAACSGRGRAGGRANDMVAKHAPTTGWEGQRGPRGAGEYPGIGQGVGAMGQRRARQVLRRLAVLPGR